MFGKEKTNAVVDYLKFSTYHVLGHGTGAEAALELGKSMGKASPRPPGPELEAVLSVTLASPVLGENELSPDFLETLRAPYTKDGIEVCLALPCGGSHCCCYLLDDRWLPCDMVLGSARPEDNVKGCVRALPEAKSLLHSSSTLLPSYIVYTAALPLCR